MNNAYKVWMSHVTYAVNDLDYMTAIMFGACWVSVSHVLPNVNSINNDMSNYSAIPVSTCRPIQ